MPKRPDRQLGLFRDPRRPWLDWSRSQAEQDGRAVLQTGRRGPQGSPATQSLTVQRYLRPSPASIENVLRLRPDEVLVLRASRHPLTGRQAVIESPAVWVAALAALLALPSLGLDGTGMRLLAAGVVVFWLALIGRRMAAVKASHTLPYQLEVHGHGLIVRDQAGHVEALPWSLVAAAWQAPGEVVLQLAPVKRATPRRLHLPDSADARGLLRAVELTQTWRAEGVVLPDLHEQVSAAALSPARLEGASPDLDRGLSVTGGDADDDTPRATTE